MAFVPVYILILGFTIVVDYFAGILIEAEHVPRRRKLLLAASLITNVGILVVFKYFNFLNLNVDILLHKFNYHNPIPYLTILLPIGLSFHTFQAMSYTIEVYRGNQKAERHFGIYSLYVMFYPQLVAGPIERPQNILPQLHTRHSFDYDLMQSGLKMMLWGFFKKLVIADRLSIFVNSVYNNPDMHNGTTIVIASFFFAIQIYCDFSGYTDIAIGCARTMGFDLMKNFDRPYFASNIQDFWRRWHISLSTWFRDYVYIPLGGSKVSGGRRYLNVFIVFLLSGIWHGANYTYIIWGVLHGLYSVVYILIKPYLRKTPENKFAAALMRFGNIVFTISLVTFAWIFFRANSVKDAFTLIHNLKSFGAMPFIGDGVSNFAQSVLAIVLLFILEYKIEYFPGKFNFFSSPNIMLRWGTLVFTILWIIIFGVFNGSQFIYFQF
ncbi:MBOAT family O-acyltransferase [Mucilaginibacter phenanthrenivorans]|uniref:MBOAT family O-acyltransferase n=1 Tax=Mucilaginibacter phenanthrenivorans TaxID=1234842 RepID=UPI00215721A6|nr:MBOAT family O-acyltransferase [Mucilaginibacter phenanthrenivorans]